MSQPYVGEIRMVGFNFAPQGWAFCDGSLLSIAQNEALFTLIGTTYGGDGQTTFALPDFRGRIPIHWGDGFNLGEKGGEEFHTLIMQEMPAHSHSAQAVAGAGTGVDPTNNSTAEIRGFLYTASGQNNTAMSPFATSISGGNLPHNNMMPYLGLNFCIALQGVFPARS